MQQGDLKNSNYASNIFLTASLPSTNALNDPFLYANIFLPVLSILPKFELKKKSYFFSFSSLGSTSLLCGCVPRSSAVFVDSERVEPTFRARTRKQVGLHAKNELVSSESIPKNMPRIQIKV
jgi:hypothetical protein